MAIVRQKRPEGNFYILDKAISEDRRLSWAARGVLIFLLGKPDHWKVSIQSLINETQDADPHSRRDAIYKIIRELEGIGYVSKVQAKCIDGSFGEVDYMVGETCSPVTDFPEAAPLTDLPLTAEPLTANPYLVSTDVLAKTKKAGRNDVRGTRLDGNWSPGIEDIQFCRAQRPDLDVIQTADQFRDYWVAQPGQKGVKRDWPATWRNWVRNQRNGGQKSFHDERAATIAGLTDGGNWNGRFDDDRTIDV
jgi:hypothetical protein